MKISNEFKVGLLTIVAIAIFFIGYRYLQGKNIFSTQNTYYVLYENVQGLVASSPVHYKGLAVGLVETLELMPGSSDKILATILVDSAVELNKKSIAEIYSTGLISDKAINLIQTTDGFLRNRIPANQLAMSGDTLYGDIQKDITETVAEEVRPVREKADNMLGSIDSILNVIKGVFDTNTQDNITQSIGSIESILGQFDKTTSKLNRLIDEEQQNLKNILSNVDTITGNLGETNTKINLLLENNANKVTSIMANVDSVVSNVSVITEKFADMELTETVEKVKSTIAEFEQILAEVNNGNGTIGALLSDADLYQKIENTTLSLDNLLNDLKDNPKKYVQFSLIERKTKEQKRQEKIDKKAQKAIDNGN